MTVNVHLTKVGNSRGIRIPRAILEQVNLEGELELIVKEGALLIRPAGQSPPGVGRHIRQCLHESEGGQRIDRAIGWKPV